MLAWPTAVTTMYCNVEIYVAHLPPIHRRRSRHEREDKIGQRSSLHDLSQQPGLQSETEIYYE